jgi:UDP-glucuronate 4-epimerase
MKVDNVVVTGCMGFIGYHVCKRLLDDGYNVIGIDKSYSEIYKLLFKEIWFEDEEPVVERIKKARISNLKEYNNFKFINKCISDYSIWDDIPRMFKVVHLAARAGIPQSIVNPYIFEKDNILCTTEFLKNMSYNDVYVPNIVYASTSSVYGGDDSNSYDGSIETDELKPLNTYALTKMYNEKQFELFSERNSITTVGLRFFTVYGQYGRTDMSIYKWTNAIYNNEKVILNNNGDMYRDYTHVNDIVNGIILSLDVDRQNNNVIFNLGTGRTVKIHDVVNMIEKNLNMKADIEYQPYPTGEVYKSLANINKAKTELGYKPTMKMEDGIKDYVKWFTKFFMKRKKHG